MQQLKSGISKEKAGDTMSSFTFKGVTSTSLDLIITNPIVRPTWQPETEFTAVIGRPRQNPFTKSWYPNSDLNISAVMADATPAKVKAIYDALRGQGHLVISTAPQEYLEAYAHLPVPEAKALLMAELPIVFECEPFANAVEPTEYNITAWTAVSSVTKVVNNGTAFCDPQIAFTASAATTNIDCNGVRISVKTPAEIVGAGYPSTYSITLDCEGELAYYTRPGGQKVACTECTTGPFPRLHTGDNYIVHSGVTAASLVMRERWY